MLSQASENPFCQHLFERNVWLIICQVEVIFWHHFSPFLGQSIRPIIVTLVILFSPIYYFSQCHSIHHGKKAESSKPSVLERFKTLSLYLIFCYQQLFCFCLKGRVMGWTWSFVPLRVKEKEAGGRSFGCGKMWERIGPHSELISDMTAFFFFLWCCNFLWVWSSPHVSTHLLQLEILESGNFCKSFLLLGLKVELWWNESSPSSSRSCFTTPCLF